MNKSTLLSVFLISAILLAGCTSSPESTPTPASEPAPAIEPLGDHLLISEVLAGVDGNNLYDFIELYNPTTEIIDLKGYSLWYQLKEEGDPTLVLVWDMSYLIPPFGHFLLGQEGQDFGTRPDLAINQPLQPARGGLILKDPARKVIDSLGWGDAPQSAIEGQPADKMENGLSLARIGNSIDSDNNQADFVLSESPAPENSGSPTNPSNLSGLELTVDVAPSVTPGEEF